MKDDVNYVGHTMEKLIARIFEANGYKLCHHGFFTAKYQDDNCDFIVKRNDIKYGITIKQSNDLTPQARLIMQTVRQLRNVRAHPGAMNCHYDIPVLVVIGEISDRVWHQIANSPGYERVVVLDICNLLYMVEDHAEIQSLFLAALPYSTDELVSKAPNLDIVKVSDTGRDREKIDEEYNVLIEELRAWTPQGRGNYAKYEKLCCTVLQKLFAEDLTLWSEQEKSNDGLFRFDLFCKIKHGNNREFWKMAEQYFNTKYIVFEFKNYSEEISQQEIFTTVKYLYAKALRSVAIMVAVKGANQYAQKAIRGILREEGKLIIVLSNQDLISMLEYKKQKKEPADYLSHLLDMLMVSLEK